MAHCHSDCEWLIFSSIDLVGWSGLLSHLANSHRPTDGPIGADAAGRHKLANHVVSSPTQAGDASTPAIWPKGGQCEHIICSGAALLLDNKVCKEAT